ncbi:MAG: T9SS type A sorting domain-containing protein [Bacteroidia bacterium]|nr:T9SS type A sorting domain-containing protein [Bacteroidia bacterium]
MKFRPSEPFLLLLVVLLYQPMRAQFADWENFTQGKTITAIEAGSGGDRWIGTLGGLVRLNSNGTTFFNHANSPLPRNEIYDLEFFKGTLWVATSKGLLAYNGATWQVFQTVNSNLSHDLLTRVAVDSLGGIWVASARTLDRYYQGYWITYDDYTLFEGDIAALEVGPNGHIWVGFLNEGQGLGGNLAEFDQTNWTKHALNPNPDGPSVYDLAFSPNGEVLAATDDEIYVYDGNSWAQDPTFGNFIQVPLVRSLSFSPAGKLWAGGLNGIYEKSGSTWILHDSLNGEALPPVEILRVQQEKQIWCGLYNAGLHAFDGNNQLTYHNTSNSPLQRNQIHKLAFDHNGMLWVLSNSPVIDLWSGSAWSEFRPLNQDTAWTSPAIGILTAENYVYLQTNKLVGKWDGSTLQTHDYFAQAGATIREMTVTENGDLWLATDLGVIRESGTGTTIFQESNSPLPGNSVKTIASGPGNTVWIGTNTPSGTYLTRFHGDKWVSWSSSDSDLWADFSDLSTDVSGNLWLSGPQGVQIFDGLIWNSFPYGMNPFFALASSGIATSAKGRVMIFGYPGAFEYNGFSDFTLIHPDFSGLSSEYVNDMAFSATGEAWFATHNGLSKWNGSFFTVNPPQDFHILPNYPNPFDDLTQVSFVLPTSDNATLDLLDLQGRILQTLVSGYSTPGLHTLTLDGTRLRPGVYLLRLRSHTTGKQWVEKILKAQAP